MKTPSPLFSDLNQGGSKVHYIPFNGDLYAITLDDFGDMVLVEVSYGNRREPFVEVHPNSLHPEVFNRLQHKLIKEL